MYFLLATIMTTIRHCSSCHAPGHYKNNCKFHGDYVLKCKTCGKVGHSENNTQFHPKYVFPQTYSPRPSMGGYRPAFYHSDYSSGSESEEEPVRGVKIPEGLPFNIDQSFMNTLKEGDFVFVMDANLSAYRLWNTIHDTLGAYDNFVAKAKAYTGLNISVKDLVSDKVQKRSTNVLRILENENLGFEELMYIYYATSTASSCRLLLQRLLSFGFGHTSSSYAIAVSSYLQCIVGVDSTKDELTNLLTCLKAFGVSLASVCSKSTFVSHCNMAKKLDVLLYIQGKEDGCCCNITDKQIDIINAERRRLKEPAPECTDMSYAPKGNETLIRSMRQKHPEYVRKALLLCQRISLVKDTKDEKCHCEMMSLL